MRQYYLDIAWRMLVSVKSAVYAVEAFTGVALFVAILFNKSIAAAIEGWEGVNPRWAILPLAVVFAHLFLKAIYEKHRELEARLPRLGGEIDGAIVGDYNRPRCAFVLVTLSIRNLGPPSAVEKYRVELEMPNALAVIGELRQEDEMQLYSGDGPTNVYLAGKETAAPEQVVRVADYIWNKTLTPIATGGMVRGVVLAIFREFSKEQISSPSVSVKVSFSDVSGAEYSRSHTLGKRGPWMHYPGM